MKKHELFQMHAERCDDVEVWAMRLARTACYLAAFVLAAGL